MRRPLFPVKVHPKLIGFADIHLQVCPIKKRLIQDSYDPLHCLY